MGKVTIKRLIKEGHIVYGATSRFEKRNDFVALGGHAIKIDIVREYEIEATV